MATVMAALSAPRKEKPSSDGCPLPSASRPAWFRKLAFVIGVAFCLTPWASPPVALTLGMLLALSIENPYPQIGKAISRKLLQTCVVLLGFSMNLHEVLQAGLKGAIFAAGTIAATLLLGYLVGKTLKIGRNVSTLISAGTAICGGSAIAAVGSVIGAAEGEMTVAIGTVFLLNAIALFIFPPLGHALHLTVPQFGTWAGVAIHDISSVVGAASRYDPSNLATLQMATAVKLSRTLWIIPMAFLAAWAFQERTAVTPATDHPTDAVSPGTRAFSHAPWFIGLFMLASLVRSFIPAVEHAVPIISHVARTGMTLTLFLIGAGLSMKALKTVGVAPLVQGIILWIFISLASLAVVAGLVQ